MFLPRREMDIETMLEKTEEALYAVAHGMNLNLLLDVPVRERLLFALDALSLVWERLRQSPPSAQLSPRDGRLLYTLCEVCAIVRDATAEETARLSEVIIRLARGLTEPFVPEVTTLIQQETSMVSDQSAPPTPAESEALEESPAESPSVAPETEAIESIPTEEVPQPEPKAEVETAQPSGEEPVAVQPQPSEQLVLPEPTPFAGLSEKLDELSAILDDIANHSLRREQAVARLMYAACLYRSLRPRATGWHREWEMEQIKRQIEQLSDKSRLGVWLPPFDPKLEFSDHELETLQKGYQALDKSWEMWGWYQQHGQELDKGAGAPLLESIAAPIPMVQQIYSAKRVLPKASEVDYTLSLREQITEEAKRRKWQMDMLTLNCARQKQNHYINRADEHWHTAQQLVQKKQAQTRVLDDLEKILTNPVPDTFEEDLLCKLVGCHQEQVPPSNLRLRHLLHGYNWLLENPAVPERCALSASASKAARSFLVKLGKYLTDDLSKQDQEQEEEPEAEPEVPQNGELLERARRVTKGKKVFLLCFNRRSEAEQRIRQKLGFAEVDWPDLDGSESLTDLEPHIRNADMTIVVVRYSRTHWKEASEIAKQYGKQFVMATKGYGVTHLTQAILAQCQAGG